MVAAHLQLPGSWERMDGRTANSGNELSYQLSWVGI
jgi:hypothetical protein